MGAIVILTGAGASKPLSYPTTIEFFPQQSPVPKEYLDIFNTIKSQIGASNPIDVEELLRVLQPADDFLQTPAGQFLGRRLNSEWNVLVPRLARHIRERCFDVYGRYPNEEEVKRLYVDILELCNWQQSALDLFTANYDPVTDVLLNIAVKAKLRAYDGFGALARWEPELYEWSEPGIRIFRLHGSMSWVRDEDRIFNSRDYTVRRGGHQRHLLIFPGFKGDPEQDRLHEVFRFTHGKLRGALKSARSLLAIGYSFRDQAINRVIAEAMSENAELKIFVLNPVWPDGINGEMAALRKQYMNNIVHIDKNFGASEAIDAIREHLS
jgi:hypothetical protein